MLPCLARSSIKQVALSTTLPDCNNNNKTCHAAHNRGNPAANLLSSHQEADPAWLPVLQDLQHAQPSLLPLPAHEAEQLGSTLKQHILVFFTRLHLYLLRQRHQRLKVDVSIVSLLGIQRKQEEALTKFKYKVDVIIISLLVPQKTIGNSFGNWLWYRDEWLWVQNLSNQSCVWKML